MPRYFEDLEVGARILSPTAEVNEAESLDFARTFDPQPMHLDPDFAARGKFHGLIVSGWYTAALVMRLVVQARLLEDTEILGMAVEEMRWPAPVRPGDTIQSEIEVVWMKPSEKNPSFGIVKFRITTRNQHGQTVMIHAPICWVPRRPAS
ncbi:MAG TPA: MaoC/PaaZ C-terminal domain-containing protein [Bryobacteraceae bacterium]|nr:MaoC/PaaZ C-terminal domain-containing protein [Bryobacteraceae bacterium]